MQKSVCRFILRKYGSVKLSSNIYENIKTVKFDKSLLITHGLLGSKQNWNAIAKNLASDFKEVVCIDLRNHGNSPHLDDISTESMAEDIHQHIVSNHYKSPILLGHSLGGKVAMYLALSQPQLLSSLIVVDVAPVVTKQIADYKSYIETMLAANIDQSLSLPDNRKRIFDELLECTKDDGIRNFLLTNLVKDGPDKVIRWRANLLALKNSLDMLTEFTVPPGGVFKGPTLFIGGEKSQYIRDKDWPRIKELFPLAALEVISGAGHWVHADKPHQFISVISQFVSVPLNR